MQQNREALSESGGSKSRNIRRRTGLGRGVLAIAGLSSLALAQPTYDLLRRMPEFFVIRILSMGDLLVLAALLAIVPTLLLSAPAAAAQVLRPAWVRPAVAAPAGLLTGVIALQAARGLPAVPATTLAVLACAGVAWAYVRSPAVRFFGLLLSGATILVPTILVVDGDVRRVVDNSRQPVAIDGAGARAPIVLAVFDEWSVISILDSEGRIDRDRFPNLARFADRATWYPNATAASNMTTHAVPAMLTGLMPERGQLPITADHPVNLFTLLGASHDVFAMETSTALCPPDLNLLQGQRPSFPQRFGLLIADLSVVWLRLTLPKTWAERLPPVTEAWSGFNWGGSGAMTSAASDQLERAKSHARGAERVTDYRRFLDSIGPPPQRPPLYFVHTLLPHAPWQHLPSGRQYPLTRFRGLDEGNWTTDRWAVRHHWKRYLLQVEFMDRLIGELMTRLESMDLFDQSLIAITADHGLSFQPGRSRRLPDPTDASGNQVLDLVAVPLIIKAPFQDRAQIDDSPVSLVDLTPRILELAGADVWTAPRRTTSNAEPLLFGRHADEIEIPADRTPWRRARLAEQRELLGESNDAMAIGTVPELHGRPLSELPLRGGNMRVLLDSADQWNDVDVEATMLPALVEAAFVDPDSPADRSVVVALNGIVADSVRPQRRPSGKSGLTAVLPETLFRPGSNQIELFLVSDRGDRLELERLQPPQAFDYRADPEYLYEVHRDSAGRIKELRRRPASEPTLASETFPVRPNSRQLRGHLEATVPQRSAAMGRRRHFQLGGWGFDPANPGQPNTVVTMVGGTDVRAFTGPALKYDSFSLRLEVDQQLVEREGIIAFAVGHRGVATRLRFSYDELERERDGREVMPISDGRRLVVQPTGNGFDGAVDLVVAVGKSTQVHGWAADLERGEPPRQIVVYRDGKFLTTLGRSNRERPDVAKHFDDPRLLRTGFRGEVLDGPLPSVFAQRHRVFAVMQRGVAVELRVLSPPGTGR